MHNKKELTYYSQNELTNYSKSVTLIRINNKVKTNYDFNLKKTFLIQMCSLNQQSLSQVCYQIFYRFHPLYQ
jgi:Holliday junction resolvase RusA-like endonuclease